MTKTLTEQDVLQMMRTLWNDRVAQLAETVDIVMHLKSSDNNSVISPELKVRHKNSGIRYTVSSVGVNDIILKTPEGDDFLVDKEELEQNYELD